MLVRFLGTVLAAHVSFLDDGAFQGLSKPTTRGTRRLAGIDLNKARNRHAVDAVVALSTRPNGFTVAQLAEAVRQRSGQDANMYSARNAADDLAKLAGKTLVRRMSDRVATQSILPECGLCVPTSFYARKSSSP
jgi:hypothetical protein